MPVDLNTLFQHVSALDDNVQFHAPAADELRQGSGLHGLKKHSDSARAAENRAAVQAFVTAVSRHPAYAAQLGAVRAPLDELMQSGRPLTAGAVRQTQLALNMALASAAGAELVRSGCLPVGHASSFAWFAASRELPLDDEAQQTAALKAYLLSELCPGGEEALSRLPDAGGEKNGAARSLMLRMHGPLEGRDGFFARELDRELSRGLNGFSFREFERSFADACADDMDLVRFLSVENLEALAVKQKPQDILAALHEARNTLGADALSDLCNRLIVRSGPLSTREERAAEVIGSLVDGLGTQAARIAMRQHGLPESFAAAVGHHPDVERRAKEALGAGSSGRIPDGRAVLDALRGAVEEFLKAKLPLLQEFAVMAQEPPVKLDPPLTAETMPRFINAMLSGDELLEPLLHDNAPLDEAFLGRLAGFALALDSASHAVEGDFGARDRNAVLENVFSLLMARRGVPQQMLPEMVSRAVTKFGRLASELNAVAGALQAGRFGYDAMMFASRLLPMAGALQIFGQQLIAAMSDGQRSGMKLDMFNTAAPGADVRELQRRGREFTEGTFQNEVPLNRISDVVRGFVRDAGVVLPARDPAAAAGLGDAEAGTLAADNLSMMEAVLSTLIPDTGRRPEPHTGEFRALMAEASAGRDFSGIDMERVNLEPMRGAVRRAAVDVTGAAVDAGRAVDPAAVRAAAEGALVQEMERLHGTMAAVDALPARTVTNGVATGFTAAEKAAMKEAAQLFGLRDVNVLAAIASAACNESFVRDLVSLGTPGVTARQVFMETHSLVGRYLTMRDALPGDAEGVENALGAAMLIGASHLSRAQAGNLAEAMRSAEARSTAGALLWLRDRGLKPKDDRMTAAMFDMMNAVRGETEAVGGRGDEARFSRWYDGRPTHPSEIPGGHNGIMTELMTLGGRDRIPDYYLCFAGHHPPLARGDWDTLAAVLSPLMESAKSSPRKDMLREWVASSAEEILAAMHDGGGPLSLPRLWDIFTGGRLGPMPASVTGMDAVARMLDAVDKAYHERVKLVEDEAFPGSNEWKLFHNSGLGVPPRKLLELIEPGSSLSLNDVRMSLEMTSMRDVTPESVYRLGEDFVRQGRSATLRFTKADGTSLSVHPVHIPKHEISADHPVLRPILDFWRDMTHSETQFLRVAQAFSQTPLIAARFMSGVFPGLQYNEHGAFTMSAVEQADGSIVMDINGDPTLPLRFHEQFLIRPDGSHVCTAFDMSRPALNGGQA